MAGIAGAVLFTGYTQILRSNVEITADNSVRNQIRMAAEVISSRSLMNSVTLNLDPPSVVAWNTLDAARVPKDATGSAAITESAQQADAQSVGGLPTDGGVRALDPWGRYYILCRWVSSQNNRNAPSMAIVSAGADGRLATDCGTAKTNLAAAGSDDKVEFMSVANVLARSATWQAQGGGTYAFGIDPSSARVAVGIDSASVDTSKSLDIGGDGRIRGDMLVNGDFNVDGTTTINVVQAGALTATTMNTGTITSTGNGTIGGTLGVTGATTLASTVAITGATTLSSTLGVTGATTLGSLSAANTSVTTLNASGATTLGSTLAVAGATTLGSTLSAGATSVSTLATSGSATLNSAAVTNNLTVGGNTVVTGNVTAANFIGNLTGNVTGNVTGSAGSVPGTGITGVVPIASGGTNATTAAAARTNLGLQIGVDVQAWDNDLDALAAASSTGFIRRTGAGTVSIGPIMQSEVPAFAGASAGTAGSLGGVPLPTAGQQNFLLRGDGTWMNPSALNAGSISQGDSSASVTDTGVGAIIFTVDGYEQARIMAGANADRSLRVNGGVGTTSPVELSVYAGSGNGNMRLSSLGTGSITLRTNGVDRFAIDGSGNGSMGGTLTATGGFVGNLTGTASSATALATARNFSITGDATASAVSFNGTADVALNASVIKLRGVDVSSTAPTANQVLQYDGGTTSWRPQTLTVSGNQIDGGTLGQTSGVRILGVDGTAGAPSYSFQSDPDTGIYRIGANQIGFSTGGALRYALDDTSSTFTRSDATSTAYLLNVRKIRNTAIVQSGDAIAALDFQGYDGASYRSAAQIITEVDAAPGVGDMPGRIRFATTPDASATPVERMRITNAGNVGIGSTSPEFLLTLNTENAAVSDGLAINQAGANSAVVRLFRTIGSFAAPTMVTSGAPLGNISASGFWTGKANPTFQSGDSRVGITFNAAENWSGATNNGTYMTFLTTPTGSATQAERMRIDAAGNVGIGQTNPTQRLHVGGVLRLDSDAATSCNATAAGAIRYNSGVFQGCDGLGTWKGIGGGTAIADGDSGVTVTDTGTGSVVISVDGAARMTVTATNITTTVPSYFPSGTAGAPSISFAADTSNDTGWFRPAENQMAASTGGTERVRIDSTGGVSIGSAAAAAVTALLDLTSTTRGFLPPRMTSTQRDAITSPATGLTIFNTTSTQLEFWNGTSWNGIGGMSNGAIAAFAAASCPTGWTEYTAARGRFLRGIDNGAGVDPAGTRTPGNQQADDVKATAANVDIPRSTGAAGAGTAAFFAQDFASVATANATVGITVGTGTETRPKNVAVIFCTYSGSGGGGTLLLSAMSDVQIVSPISGDLLTYNGTKWVNAASGSVMFSTITQGDSNVTVTDAGTGVVTIQTDGVQRVAIGATDVNFNGKTAFTTNDSYLRINQGAAFTSGTWFGSTAVMIGGGSGSFSVGSNGGTTNSRVYINGGTWNGTNVINLDGATGNTFAAGQAVVGNLLTNGGFDTGALIDIGNPGVDYPGNTGWTGTWNSNMLLSALNTSTITFHDSGCCVGALGYTANQFFFDGAGSWGPVRLGINTRTPGQALDVVGTINASADVRAPLFYDSNNTSFYVDPTGSTVLTNAFADIYYDRNNNGFYADMNNTSLFNAFRANSVTAGTTAAPLSGRWFEVTNGSDGLSMGQSADNTHTIQTYIDGQWAARATYASGCCNTLFINPDAGDVSIGNGSRSITANGNFYAPIMYDQNDNGYFVNPNSQSNLWDVRAAIFYDIQNTGFYLDPASTSVMSVSYQSFIYDRDNSAFYVDPNSVSVFNDARASIFYDRDNTSYYMDMAGATILNELYVNGWFRVNSGSKGFYWQAYDRGFYMQDTTWIRAYNGAERLLFNGYFHNSDARLKHDIKNDTRDPFVIVKGLQAVYFKWNRDNSDDYGVIAQQTKKVLPEVVTQDDKGLMQVSYDKLVLPVIEAVKKLIDWSEVTDKRLDAIEKQLNELKAENAALKSELAKVKTKP